MLFLKGILLPQKDYWTVQLQIQYTELEQFYIHFFKGTKVLRTTRPKLGKKQEQIKNV